MRWIEYQPLYLADTRSEGQHDAVLMGVDIHKLKSWNVLRANSASISTMSEMFGSA